MFVNGPFALLDGHEQVVYGSDPESGLRCIVAIASTALGPALGGTRFHDYASEADALADVLRLSKAMAYKAACAGLDLGGGKAVILGDPATVKTEALLRAYGRVVESLGGRYVTACDVGTTPADLAVVGRETRWAKGADPVEGGSGDSGIMTAYGTYVGMKALSDEVWGSDSLGARHVAVLGVGKVGRRLAEHLHAEGAKLTVADVDPAATERCVERFGADVVGVDEIALLDADIFSPNALGGTITEALVPQLKARLIAGAANNQLAAPHLGEALKDAGILYAPDYVINAGGLLQVADELHPAGYSEARVRARAGGIGIRLREIARVAREQGIATSQAADRVATARIAALGRLRGFWLPAR